MKDLQTTIVCVPREVLSTGPRFVETLYTRTATPFELVYVDAGSPPPVRRRLEQLAGTHQFTLIRTEEFLAPNEARNLGAAQVDTPYTLFIDNDALVARGWLQPLLQCAVETGAWAVGPIYYELLPELHRIHMAGGRGRLLEEPDGRRYYMEEHDHGQTLAADVELPSDWFETKLLEWHAMLMPTAVYRQLGPFDERLLGWADHSDFSLAVQQAGGKLMMTPHSRITYAPPMRLRGADRRYFELRWSEAWIEGAVERFVEKHSLDPDHARIHAARYWLRTHRRRGSRTLKLLKRTLGRRTAGWIQHQWFNPWELVWSRRRYPRDTYCRRQAPAARLVASPRGLAKAA